MPSNDAEEAALDIFKDLGQDFAALIGRLNAENVKGRAELAENLRAEIEESRTTNSRGREKLAEDLRTEIGAARAAAVEESKAALKALVPGLLWKLLSGIAAMLAVLGYLTH